MMKNLFSVKWGIALAVLTILLGFVLGAAMGGAESQIKEAWTAAAQPGLTTVYQNDPQKITMIVERSWKMLQRAHMHAAAIGTAVLVLLAILAQLNIADLSKKVISLCLGLGGLGYSFSWLYVAFLASSVGNIPQTKDQIHIVAALSIAMLLFGTVSVLALSTKALFMAAKKDSL